MGMFTKLFSKSHEPYEIPGARWYHFVLETDEDLYITVKDGDFEILSDFPETINYPAIYADADSPEIFFFDLQIIDKKVIIAPKDTAPNSGAFRDDKLLVFNNFNDGGIYSSITADESFLFPSNCIIDLYLYGFTYDYTIVLE